MPRNYYAVVLAGGGGTRLWPVSRKRIPKQVIPILPIGNGDTLIAQTWKRLTKSFSPSRILVVTAAAHEYLVREELPDLPKENWIFEPEKRDTGVALAVAAAKIGRRDPKAIIVNINSDAHIKDTREYVRILRLAYTVLKKRSTSLVLVGVKPTYPETGYGYIKMGSQAMRIAHGKGRWDEVFAVERFVEKPDYETAKQYLIRWEYLWNPTLLVARVASFRALIKKYQPRLEKALQELAPSLGTSRERPALADSYARLAPVNLDRGILERAKDMLVIPANFGWSDVGNWRTIKDILSSRNGVNVVRGNYVPVHSRGNLVYSFSDKVVATIGLTDHIVIDTPDALLICPKDRAQDVKEVVEKLEEKYK